jgi:hypothetical protein
VFTFNLFLMLIAELLCSSFSLLLLSFRNYSASYILPNLGFEQLSSIRDFDFRITFFEVDCPRLFVLKLFCVPQLLMTENALFCCSAFLTLTHLYSYGRLGAFMVLLMTM